MTALVLLQSPAPTDVAVSDTASLTLAVEAGAVSTDATARVGLFLLFQSDLTDTTSVNVSDTASLSATEGDVDSFDIVSSDEAALSLAEVITAAISVSRGDTASLAIADVSAVNISGNVAVNVTDTTSLSVTDAGDPKVDVAVTDTASLTLTDSGAVTVDTLTISVADDIVPVLSEAAAITASVALVNVAVTDTVSLTADDLSAVLDVVGEVFPVTDTASLSIVDSGVVTIQDRPVRYVLVEALIPKVLIN